MEIPNKYDPKIEEPEIQKFWEGNKIFAFDVNSKKKIYSIDTPPPTVSGKMHMGHAFGNSQQDFVARYRRMKGFNVLQPFGTDDNGLPTQTLIQKMKKVKASRMDREEFIKLCNDTLAKELRPKYLSDWKRLGISCDWDASYSTIDDHCRKISQWSFIDLYEKGKAYRKEAPVIWCTSCQTAVAQVELQDEELKSSFNDIIFKVDGKDLVVATTRPELLSACVAIFFHPEDKRYKKYEGKKATVPLFNFEVPILPDEKADPEKGTGIVMCCTFGDQTDIEWQKQHDLPIKMAISRDGKMTEIANGYQGLKVKEAREKIIEGLKENKLLVNQKEITHAVNTHERCGSEVEFVHSKQWFIQYLDLKEDMLKWGNELQWFPMHMKNRYDNWVNGLQWDWCISRQIYFGIPFPVWYCECGEIYLAKEKDLPVDPLNDKPPVKECVKCKSKKFIGEKDIINTWATSSLTPLIVKDLFKGTPIYDKLIKQPMDLRPQGHDIISFWLFNTVVKSKLHFKQKPWNDCFINGWMLDSKGKKMSKKLGNIVEPQGMIEKYSADALRFMSAGCKLGEDFPFQEKDLVTGVKITNKIWNASKFSFMHLEDFDIKLKPKLQLMDRWILSKVHKLIDFCTDSFEKHDFSKAKLETEKFFYQILCDQYLEIVKDRLYNPDTRGKEEKQAAQFALYRSLLYSMKLLSPIMPFITEKIYKLFFEAFEGENSIHISEWPKFEKKYIDNDSEEAGDAIIEVISFVRKYKSDNKMSLKIEIDKLTIPNKYEKLISTALDDIKATTRAKEIVFGKEVKVE